MIDEQNIHAHLAQAKLMGLEGVFSPLCRLVVCVCDLVGVGGELRTLTADNIN